MRGSKWHVQRLEARVAELEGVVGTLIDAVFAAEPEATGQPAEPDETPKARKSAPNKKP